jgi:glycosyltransferase involved in cell wall biosynthesis
MKALIITESYLPNIGGVEKHIASTLPYLEAADFDIKIISKKEIFKNRKLLKFFGLLQIWWAMARRITLIKEAEVVFVHDVFIYYLPFRFIFPKKKVITVFHGWEKIYPIPVKNVFYKRLAQKFSTSTISIGQYINKYYQLNNANNYISYGAVDLPKEIDSAKKEKNSFLFVGRLEKDTGLSIFIEFLDILIEKNIIFSVKFCGDGPMKEICKEYGETLGFTDVSKHLEKTENCFAGGYLAILEAMAYKNIVLSAYQNDLKRDYLLESPFSKSIAYGNSGQDLFDNYSSLKNRNELIEENYQLAQKHSFEKLADLYIKISKS